MGKLKDSGELTLALDFENESATMDKMAKSNNKPNPEDNMAKSLTNFDSWLAAQHGTGGGGGGVWTGKLAPINLGPPCEHGTIKRLPLPRRIKGQLWGAAGAKLKDNTLQANGITMFVPMAGIAFGAAESFDGFVFGCPMEDFGCWPVPLLVSRARWIAGRVLEGHNVCIACHGGHGRTGTLLAAVAVALRVRAASKDPVAWVRDVFCSRAVETAGQEAAVAAARDTLAREVG